MHFDEDIVNIIGKLISPNLYPNTIDINENCTISTIEIDDDIYENYRYVDILSHLVNRERPLIPLGININNK